MVVAGAGGADTLLSFEESGRPVCGGVRVVQVVVPPLLCAVPDGVVGGVGGLVGC